jgi:hypothetical protein
MKHYPQAECRHVWDASTEPWKPRTQYTCVRCGAIFRDMEHYLVELTEDLPVKSVLDVGTGKKGVVGEYYWAHYKDIKEGYMCDIWTLKEMPSLWTPLKMDALDLYDVFGEKGVDVVQAFGFLEHLEREEGYQFLNIAEDIAAKLVIVSAATCIHGVDEECSDDPLYKVRLDGNPHHAYRSVWHWSEFKALGYETNLRDKMEGKSFRTEAIAWKLEP